MARPRRFRAQYRAQEPKNDEGIRVVEAENDDDEEAEEIRLDENNAADDDADEARVVGVTKNVPAQPINFGGLQVQPTLDPSFTFDEGLGSASCETAQELIDYVASGRNNMAVCFPSGNRTIMCLPPDTRKSHCQLEFACLWCAAVESAINTVDGSEVPSFKVNGLPSLVNRHNHGSCPNRYNFLELVSAVALY